MTTHYERRGDVAVLQIDNAPVNGLGHTTRRSLVEGLERALDDAAVKAIVITGTDKVFSGGADIREFNTPAALAEPNLLQLIERVEASPKAVIAAINGVCMGGGLELSLGCNYRIATSARAAVNIAAGSTPAGTGTGRSRSFGCALRPATSFAKASTPSNDARSTIFSTSPLFSASSAFIGSPVVIIRRPFSAPTARGSRWVPPAPGSRPIFTSGRPIEASGVAMR